jgi:hypothetical protein
MMFALMDADGDGTISLQEFQAAHERIFKAMDSMALLRGGFLIYRKRNHHPVHRWMLPEREERVIMIDASSRVYA